VTHDLTLTAYCTQFVPQLMLGNALSGSTGPPNYDATWGNYSTWTFGSQYFMEINNATATGIPKAATGDLFVTVSGETLFTAFARVGGVWTLTMGVVGDATRTSVVVAGAPYMGLLADVTKSWVEPAYDHVHVNGCWELYGVDTPHAFPSTGSNYSWTTAAAAPGAIPWAAPASAWSNIETPTCPGGPTATFAEGHTPSAQTVSWNITYPFE
jgi:hypothetical protein